MFGVANPGGELFCWWCCCWRCESPNIDSDAERPIGEPMEELLDIEFCFMKSGEVLPEGEFGVSDGDECPKREYHTA